jgi:hypothetical protein
MFTKSLVSKDGCKSRSAWRGSCRALESVFGGVTHELLADPSLPIFTAH